MAGALMMRQSKAAARKPKRRVGHEGLLPAEPSLDGFRATGGLGVCLASR
jgi:hypothetical protein